MVNHRRTSAHRSGATVVLNTSVAEGIVTIDISFTRLTDSRCERTQSVGPAKANPSPQAVMMQAGSPSISAIRRSREIQICAGDITRTAVFGAQVKPVTVGKALIAGPSQSLSRASQRSSTGSGPMQVQPSAPLQRRVPAQRPNSFSFAQGSPIGSPSSMAPLQSLSIPSPASAVGSGALQPDQPIPGWQVSSPKQRPSKPSAVLTQALVSPAWSSEQSQNAISGIHWGTSKDCPEASSV